MLPDVNQDSSMRVRDNQRRSRARRKEYIQELEIRLRHCERSGIQASQELQVAARNVALENVRLRTLLKTHGVAENEIDGCVNAANQELQAAGSRAKAGANPADAVQHDAVEREAPLRRATAMQISEAPFNARQHSQSAVSAIHHDQNLTSCETAAWMIANLRGLDNTDAVRAELGCSDKTYCTVNNLEVFNQLDDSFS